MTSSSVIRTIEGLSSVNFRVPASNLAGSLVQVSLGLLKFYLSGNFKVPIGKTIKSLVQVLLGLLKFYSLVNLRAQQTSQSGHSRLIII